MIKAGQVSKGLCLIIKNEPHSIVEREFVNPGKGSAFVRLKLKNLKTGLVTRQVSKTHEELTEADVETKEAQFLYSDENGYVFMDTVTYDQLVVPLEGLETKVAFLKEGEVFQLLMWESTAIDILLPAKMTLEVVESHEGNRGDTVGGATKTVTTETGLKVKTPLFVKKGDKLLVNTATQEYVERAN